MKNKTTTAKLVRIIAACAVILIISMMPKQMNAQWSTNPALNTAICTASGEQQAQSAISDGLGGAIIVWEDSRNGSNYDIYVQRINASGIVQWTANGVAVCTSTNNQLNPKIVSDGSGGAIITWFDGRNGNDDIYAQRINTAGQVQWNSNGIGICTAAGNQQNPTIASDGSGGAIITWYDLRNGIDDNIYAQSINSTGIVQWTANGVAICVSTNTQYYPIIVSDGSGGAIITWQDQRSSFYDIYAQRINASGVVQWQTNGVGICTATSVQMLPKITSDNAGGAIITWQDSRLGTNIYDIYAQCINANGIVQWTANGVVICAASGNQTSPNLISDGSGGAIIAWQDLRNGNYDVYTQRLNASGTILWTTNGVAICTSINSQPAPTLVSNGFGGAIITWYDGRNNNNYYDIYAQCINASGVVQWTTDGVAISISATHKLYPIIVSDGSGGAIIVWYQGVDSFILGANAPYWDIYAQKIYSNGTLCASVLPAYTPICYPASTTNCGTQSTTISFAGGPLNGATSWQWYSGTCGGTPVGTGTSITVSPTVTTNYYVRGEGGCIPPGGCGGATIIVNPLQTWYMDADNDGYYVGSPVTSCTSPGAGYNTTATVAGDCNDNNPLHTTSCCDLKAYINRSGFLDVVDLATNTVESTISGLSGGGKGIAFSPDGSHVYLTTQNGNSVDVVNTSTNTLTTSIAVGNYSLGIAVTPNGSKAYVANYQSANVSVINTTTNTVSATIPVGNHPFGVVVSPDGSKVYVTNEFSNTISVINTATDNVTATIAIGGNYLMSPRGIAVTPDGSKLYFTSFNGGFVSAVNTSTNTISTTLTVGGSPEGIVVTPDGSKVYVSNTNGNTVSAINTATNTVSATVAVGGASQGLSVSSDGNFVYVVVNGTATLAVINAAANTISTNVVLPSYPSANFGNFIGCVTPCTPVTWYQDLDGDGFGNANVTLSACLQPTGYVADNTDCMDLNGEVHTLASSLVISVTNVTVNSATVDVTPFSTNAQYMVTSNGGVSFIGPVSLPYTFTGLSPFTNYAIGVKFPTNNCNNTLYTTGITTQGEGCNGVPVTPVISGPNALCNLATAVYTVAPVAGAINYIWTVPTGMTITLGQGTTSINVSISGGTVTGNVTCMAHNNCGNSVAAALALSKKPAAPGLITGPASLCGLTSATFSIAPAFGATSYNWTLPSGITITGGQGTTTITVNIAAWTVIGNVSVTAGNGCGTSAARTLAITKKPGSTGLVNGTASVCGQAQATFTIAQMVGASGYNWTLPTGMTLFSGSGTTSITVNIATTFVSGNISVAAVNACGNGPVTTQLVTANVPPVPVSISGPLNVCGITSATYSTPTQAGATGHLWTITGTGNSIVGSNTGLTVNCILSGTSAGTISCRGTNACGSGLTRTLNLTIAAVQPAAIIGPTNTCGMSTAAFSVPSLGTGYTYNWTLPAFVTWPGAIVQTSNAITVNISGNTGTIQSSGGTLKVSSTNSCGQTSALRTMALTRCADPVAMNNGDENMENEIAIYPNPFTNQFQISNFKSQISDVMLYNLLGEIVFQSTINSHPELVEGQQSTINIDVSNFAKGIYFIQMNTEQGIVSRKIIKE